MGAGTLLLLGVLAMIVALAALSGPTRSGPVAAPPASSPPRPAPVGEGGAGVIHAPGDAGAWLAIDDAAWAEMVRAQAQSEPSYMAELARLGRVFHAHDGTRVRVVRRGAASSLVRVAGGVRDGLTGWVQAEFVAPDGRSREDVP